MGGEATRFKPGHKLAKGGKREGAGRKPNWFREAVEKEFRKGDLKGLKLVGKIARGEQEVEKLFNDDGRIIRAKTGVTPSDIISANEWLADRFHGKPTQAIEFTGDNVVNLIEAIRQARAKRGLPLE